MRTSLFPVKLWRVLCTYHYSLYWYWIGVLLFVSVAYVHPPMIILSKPQIRKFESDKRTFHHIQLQKKSWKYILNWSFLEMFYVLLEQWDSIFEIWTILEDPAVGGTLPLILQQFFISSYGKPGIHPQPFFPLIPTRISYRALLNLSDWSPYFKIL